MSELIDYPQQLSREKMRNAQKRLMDTCRFQDLAGGWYIAPGETRTVTGGTVLIRKSTGIVTFCPYKKVDGEVDIICHMAKVSSGPLLEFAGVCS